jgi:hypothetical protein
MALGPTVTVTPYPEGIQLFLGPSWGGKIVFCSFQFGDGTTIYPTNGIPIPDPGQFKFNYSVPPQWIEFMPSVNTGSAANKYRYIFDPTVRTGAPYGTLRIIDTTTGTEFSGAVPATTLNAMVWGK